MDSWWAQSVTVGWERITGRRLPHQRPDGTFSASKSASMAIDGAALRALLLDDEGRVDLFGGESIELRSRPTSNNVRLGMPLGTAEIAIDERDDGRVRITVAHERLEEYDDVARWRTSGRAGSTTSPRSDRAHGAFRMGTPRRGPPMRQPWSGKPRGRRGHRPPGSGGLFIRQAPPSILQYQSVPRAQTPI